MKNCTLIFCLLLITTFNIESATLVIGTAFFYNENGDMFTNKHVIENCLSNKIIVETYDKQLYPATVLAVDDLFDIAAIRIDKKVNSFASVYSRNNFVIVPDEDEDVFSGGYSSPQKNNFKIQIIWGLIEASKKSNKFPFVNRIRMKAYSGASGSPIINYAGLLVGILFASSKTPLENNIENLKEFGYGDKWVYMFNNNALIDFANRHQLKYVTWSEWKQQDPLFLFDHINRITGLVICQTQ